MAIAACGSGGSLLRNADNGQCLEADGSSVKMATCSASRRAQLWRNA